MLKELIKRAWAMGASDLHLAAGYYPMLRIDGSLQVLALPAQRQELFSNQEYLVADTGLSYGKRLTEADITAYLEQVLQAKHLRILKEAGEVDFALMLSPQMRCRINVYKAKNSLAMAIRFLSKNVPDCQELTLTPVIQSFVNAKHGLVLITGPTGCGKSSTLAALVQKLNSEQCKHIITLEQPIEYVYPEGLCMISQREIGEDTQSFSTGIYSALREDPDVIMVGELREPEALRVALQAAETGHLVLSTLHTRDAVTSINRMLDMLPYERSQVQAQLADCLVGIVSQELFKRKNAKGRVAAREILVNNKAVSNLIREGKTHQLSSYLQTGGSLGMQTMETSIARLRREGII